MSEKIYAWLLLLYPSSFRRLYGEEALQLFRDRSRDEKGILPGLRLWLDLLTDLAIAVPREYRRVQPALAGASSQQRLHGAPGFHVLEYEAPRLSAQFCGVIISLLAFGSILLMIGHGRSIRQRREMSSQTRSAGYLHSPQQAIGEAESIISRQLAKEDGKLASGDSTLAEAKPASFKFEQVSYSTSQGPAQPPSALPYPQDATSAVIQAFNTHKVVMFGETHANKQEYEWLCKLVGTPAFADRVDDIVVEFGNSLYQKSVDRYIAGQDVPLEQVQKAWRNMIGSVGPPSPVYEQFYQAVRAANLKRHGQHPIRIVLGDPYGDWDKIKDAEDLGPYVAQRDEWYAQVVKEEVLAKNHHALLIMGAGHFLRRNGPGYVEREIRAAGANPYLIVFGTNAVGGYYDLDERFNSWPRPAIVALSGNWVGELPQSPVTTGGLVPANALKLADAADALLYVGPRDSLTQLNMPRAELDGTPYGKELVRRIMIMTGQPANLFSDQTESAQFRKPQPQAGSGGPHSMPMSPPRSMHDPLPPRPPSQ